MPRGVPKSGFRMTKKRLAGGKIGNKNAGVLTAHTSPVVVSTETEQEIREKLTLRFSAMNEMAESAVQGDVRALIISGPAGVGKSHGVTEILTKHNPYHIHISGYVRPTGLYKTLHEFRAPGSVIVFDDADSIFSDDVSLNLLKAACDSRKVRTLSWLTETKMEDEAGDQLPRSFEFEGTVIFITNMDFDFMIDRGSKLSPHLQAMISRSNYLDMAMKTKKDYLVRIKQVIEGGMLRDKGLNKAAEAEIIEFIDENQDKFRELSLRMVDKVSDWYLSKPTNWKNLAKLGCCRI